MTRTILILLVLSGIVCTFYGFSVESIRVFEIGIGLAFSAVGFVAIYALAGSIVNRSDRQINR